MTITMPSGEVEHYLTACDLLAVIDAEAKSEMVASRELLDSGVAVSRVRRLYPLDEDRLGRAIASKLANEDALLQFLGKAMNSYSQSEFDEAALTTSTEALDWAEDLALKNVKDLPLSARVLQPPEGWSSKHAATQLFDILVSLHTVLHALANWNEVRNEFCAEELGGSGVYDAEAAQEVAAFDLQLEKWCTAMLPIWEEL